MRICLTGGAGFIGSHVLDALCAGGHETLIIDDLRAGRRENLEQHESHGCHTLAELDICTPVAGQRLLDFGPAGVIHLAAQPSVMRSVAMPLLDCEVNLAGSLRVFDAARQVGAKVVAASSGGTIYGSHREPVGASAEHFSRRSDSPYALTKRVMVEYLELYERLYDLEWVALALGNAYGPRQRAAAGYGVVAIFADAMLTGRPVQVYGDGLSTRDYIHVRDVAGAFVHAVSAGQGIYNIGSGTSRTTRQVLDAVARSAGLAEPAVDWQPERLGDVRFVTLDITGCVELGWSPQIGFPEGVDDVVQATLAGRQLLEDPR
ncbi:NAD-dependent epimerase/dehydratase family protein [Kribbella albertanoniae]|uniref:NAD-dependent epimerase/dehydratase family protein n=1 Tax=Kribbella albertanoniae TaxID=1266829 RepID=A0A4R4QIC6_9ACTN|nr:NAD-dependent epimerase/dehydratase family protein [Kribbella albertanoniae]TDC35521.1 NAD-dependent epimerase/dehydratase family protein [Kribbella albertanoniae]